MRKRILKITAGVALVLIVAVVGTGLWVRAKVKGSLPRLDGEIVAAELTAPVTVERDGLGIPTIRADNRVDVAFATGFVHAQDRFFQMDLLRRNSAGELAELVGPAVLDGRSQGARASLSRRGPARARRRQRRTIARCSKRMPRASTPGSASLSVKPFEYLLLGSRAGAVEARGLGAGDVLDVSRPARRRLSRRSDAGPDARPAAAGAMFEFLAPRGTQWDAPIDGEAFAVPPMPGPEVFDTREPDAGRQQSARAARAAARSRTRFIRAATTGPSRASTRPTAGRWWPTTCTWAFACRTSGIGRRSSGPRATAATKAAR